jgi:hypothetical protein
MTVREAAEAFYKGGQKDPEPVLALLASLLKKNFALHVLPEEKRDPDAFYWISAWSGGRDGLAEIPMQALFERAMYEKDALGVLLDPGDHPLYLSGDLLEELRKRAGLPPWENKKEVSPSARDLLEEGDRLREDPNAFSCEKSLSAYQKAYAKAVREKDSWVYPEICLRLGEFHPGLYSHEDLLALFDEAIAHFRLRVSQGDKEAPERLVCALRLKEQAQARGDGRMRPRRTLPESFFEF